MDRDIKVHELYRHFKGETYIVLGIGEHTETGEQMVIYQAASYSCDKIYTRPHSMFASEVDREKYPNAAQKYRFEFVETIGLDQLNDGGII